MKLPAAPLVLADPPLPDNYQEVADQLSRALGPYPVILRRNGLLRVVYTSMSTPKTAIAVGHHGGPRFEERTFRSRVEWAVRQMGPHPNDWTLVTLQMRTRPSSDVLGNVCLHLGATTTGNLAFKKEKSEKTLNRLRRLSRAGLVYEIEHCPDIPRTKSHECVWDLTALGNSSAIAIRRKHGWK